MKTNKIYILGIIVIFILGAFACLPIGELKEDLRTVELGTATSAEIELKFGAGEIEIYGGAEELLEGVFEYNVEQWRPEIDHQVRDSRAFLSIRQGDSTGIPAGKGKNSWEIYLNEQIPIDLIMDMGAGEGDLNFEDIDLRSLEVDMGVGDIKVDISGTYQHDMNVYIDGGVGAITLYLPRDIGVMVKADKGIGSISSRDFIKKGDTLVNEIYGETDVEIKVNIDTGIGSISLKLR
ncbi:MAG TPA: toast rack family protein [Acidobacteriota bacterium]|nr:toast rack family protein [Acidobacteriota bacterium]